jgi:hypothetical protein
VASVAMSEETSAYNSEERNRAIKDNAGKFFKMFTLPCILIALFMGVLTAAFPSSKTIAVMYAVPAIVNSTAVQKDLPELYKMGVDSLKEQLAPKTTAKLEAPAK